MYLIIDKATQAILHMSNSNPGEVKQAIELLPGFDPATMVFGRAEQQSIPIRFAIEDGVVKNLDARPQAPTVKPAETLAQARERRLADITAQSLFARSQLVPDYQLLNAGLGLYDEAKVGVLRATVQAFRDESNRLAEAIAKARTIAAIDALQPAFPTALVQPPDAKPARRAVKPR